MNDKDIKTLAKDQLKQKAFARISELRELKPKQPDTKELKKVS